MQISVSTLSVVLPLMPLTTFNQVECMSVCLFTQCIQFSWTLGRIENKAWDVDIELFSSSKYQQNSTSVDANYFMYTINEVGWPQNGVFSALLSGLDYSFHEKWGRFVTRKEYWRVAPVLALLIFEQ